MFGALGFQETRNLTGDPAGTTLWELGIVREVTGAGQTVPGGTPTTTVDWTITSNDRLTWSAAGVALKPASSNGVIPEPSTVLLFGTGLAPLAVWRYRKAQMR